MKKAVADDSGYESPYEEREEYYEVGEPVRISGSALLVIIIVIIAAIVLIYQFAL